MVTLKKKVVRPYDEQFVPCAQRWKLELVGVRQLVALNESIENKVCGSAETVICGKRPCHHAFNVLIF